MGPQMGPLFVSRAFPFNLQTQLIYFSLWKTLPGEVLLLCNAAARGSSRQMNLTAQKHAFWQPRQAGDRCGAGESRPSCDLRELYPVGSSDTTSKCSEGSLNHTHARSLSLGSLQWAATFSRLRLWGGTARTPKYTLIRWFPWFIICLPAGLPGIQGLWTAIGGMSPKRI